MKFFIVIVILNLSLSHYALNQNLEGLVLVGKERYTLLEERCYIFTITSDSTVLVEAYKQSKGQTFYFNLFKGNNDAFVPEILDFKLEKVEKEPGQLVFNDSSSIICNENDWYFITNKRIIRLNHAVKPFDNLNKLRNKSLLTYAFYSANTLLGIDREFTYEELLLVKKVINDEETVESVEKMDFFDFRYFLIHQLNAILSN